MSLILGMVVCLGGSQRDRTLLSGYLLEPRLWCETTSRDVFWSYIIMANLFIVLLIEYVSSILSSMPMM